ncbi:hypothetical protein N7495_009207 [Penicillium taxi]|uniref:uncharacterized protein n=1 Tax=Penicillium taxi TaxID=168475 RepID=UPI0025458229|nr:uncharacterized protein N7495_009207 [Penicillium taxi]KAJ5884697.1 hypothetical protein N7495_009207 [Penicillium taxi]
MPGVPSNKACDRCKKRHLKCDETRPHCQRCISTGVECPGYVQTRKFIDQGATVRRRFAPYQEPQPKPDTTNKTGRDTEPVSYPAQNQPLESHENQPMDLSNQGKIEPPFQMEEARPDPQSNLQRPDGNNPLGQSDMVTHTKFAIPETPGTRPFPRLNHLSAFEGSLLSKGTINSPISPSITRLSTGPENIPRPGSTGRPDYHGLLSTESPSQRSEHEEFQDIFSELMTGTEHEYAFLGRHYTEIVGPWLDLSDSGKYFSVHVPIRAINCNSLKYAIASIAAKQLGRVKGAKSHASGGMFTSPATTEIYPGADQVDWFLKAANYYYMAVSDLNSSMSGGYNNVSTSTVLDSSIEVVNRWLRAHSTQGLGSNDNSFLREIEDMLSTVTILSLYRLLDSKGNQWHTHISGIHTLFNSLLKMSQTESVFFSHGIRASFWNFVRQDYLGSYFNRSNTHLNPADIDLWRAAGIEIDGQGKVHINNTGLINSASGAFIHSPPEDQASNGLAWLVTKVINLLSHSKQTQIAQWTGSTPTNQNGTNQESGTAPMASSPSSVPDPNTWLGLSFEFQTWFEAVPEVFRPCVRLEHPRDLSKPAEGSQLPFPEIYYTLATCAATMQHYHFGRVALLLNRPSDVVGAPSTAFDRLQGYREVTKEVEYRCREICGIALGRPQGEVRANMIPLLVAAGQCLEGAEEHQIIVDLLRGVEADLGWNTEHAIQTLQTSWTGREL